MNAEHFSNVMFIFCLVAVTVYIWLFLLERWNRFVQKRNEKNGEKNGEKRTEKNDHEVTVQANYNWLKPICKECPYFIDGSEETGNGFGVSRCVRPISATGAKCLGKHVMKFPAYSNKESTHYES